MAGNVAGAVYVVTVSNGTISNTLQSDLDGLGAALKTRALAITTAITHGVSQSILLAGLIAGVALVIAALITLWLLRSITRPSAEVTWAAEGLARPGWASRSSSGP